MAEFVLVHGSGQNASSWKRVASLLRLRGHAVATPDLPKHESTWRLEDHAACIADAIVSARAIVVAHSLCGVLLPLIPRRRTIARMVFVAAVIPEPGKSIRQQFAGDAEMFHPEWIAAGARWFDPTQVEVLAREFLFHDCAPVTIPFALATMEPMDTHELVLQPCPLTSWPEVPATAIVAMRDRTLTASWCAKSATRVLGQDAIGIDGGHCPQVSRPGELAELLGQLAG